MAQAVTYADLRFVKRPPDTAGRAPPPDESSEGGELTYENFPAGRQRAPEEGGGGRGAGQAPRRPPRLSLAGACRRPSRSAAALLALLAASLCLLAACVALGVRHWQVSRQLLSASQRHAMENVTLVQRINSQEENLKRSTQELLQARAELSATRRALGESWQAGNRTQRQLEEEQRQAQTIQDLLKQAQTIQEEAESNLALLQQKLESVRSCQENGCCPPGWSLFRWKCFWVSATGKSWEASNRDCKAKSSQLLILKPWDAATFWDAGIRSHLQSQEFWIGLSRTWSGRNYFQWVDGTYYEGSVGRANGDCVKMSNGVLKRADCDRSSRYICEKATQPFPERSYGF